MLKGDPLPSLILALVLERDAEVVAVRSTDGIVVIVISGLADNSADVSDEACDTDGIVDGEV